MAAINSKSELNIKIHLVLNEQEARALLALTAYGTNGFLEMFYTHMGKAQLSPSESGLKNLFDSVKELLPPELNKIDVARKAFIDQSNGK